MAGLVKEKRAFESVIGLVEEHCPGEVGVTVILRAKHTLSRELASLADLSEELMMLESLGNDPHQPFFSIITANAAIMEQ
jgi:hypothetical protein